MGIVFYYVCMCVCIDCVCDNCVIGSSLGLVICLVIVVFGWFGFRLIGFGSLVTVRVVFWLIVDRLGGLPSCLFGFIAA